MSLVWTYSQSPRMGIPKARRRRLSISPAESFLQGHCTRIAKGIQRCGRTATASSLQLPAHEVLRLGRTQRTRRKSSCITAASVDGRHTLRGSAMRGPRCCRDIVSFFSSRCCAITLSTSVCDAGCEIFAFCADVGC